MRFDREMDLNTFSQTRTILCIPVHGYDNDIVGVLQLVNKRDGLFSHLDEKLVEVFASHCALAHRYKILYNKTVRSVSINKLIIFRAMNDSISIERFLQKTLKIIILLINIQVLAHLKIHFNYFHAN